MSNTKGASLTRDQAGIGATHDEAPRPHLAVSAAAHPGIANPRVPRFRRSVRSRVTATVRWRDSSRIDRRDCDAPLILHHEVLRLQPQVHNKSPG